MLPCLTLSNIKYVSRVKWNNPGKGVAPSTTPWCCSYRKGRLLVALDNDRQLYFFLIVTGKYLSSNSGILVAIMVNIVFETESYLKNDDYHGHPLVLTSLGKT